MSPKLRTVSLVAPAAVVVAASVSSAKIASMRRVGGALVVIIGPLVLAIAAFGVAYLAAGRRHL